MQFFIFQSVVLAGVAGFIFGALWYSPGLFLSFWLKGEGISKETMPKRSLKYLVQVNIYSLLSHVAMASVLALMFDLLQVPSLKVALSLGLLLCIGFIITTRYVDMIYTVHGVHYSRQAQIKFLVSSGYYVFTVAVMSLILFLLA